jgi:hypothetical protein
MQYYNDSSVGAAGSYSVSVSETFVSDYADTVGIDSDLKEQVYFENTSGLSGIDPAFRIHHCDTVSFADNPVDPSLVTNASILVLGVKNDLIFSDTGSDTISINRHGTSPSDNTMTFNGPDDTLHEAGTDDFVKQGWMSGNILSGAMANGYDDTIDGGMNTSIEMRFASLGMGNNLWLAAGHTGTSSITISGAMYMGNPELDGYTIENVNPAYDQFNIGKATILGDTVSGGSSTIELSNNVILVFKGYTGPDDALFAGHH